MKNTSSGRVLMLGLDGFDAALAERFMAAGKMPNLQRLLAQCARFPLEHGMHRYTGLAGEHVASGQAPEISGRWSAVEFDPDTYIATQPDTTLVPFTNHLPGKTVVFDAPYFDLHKAHGTYGLVGWGAHDPGIQLQSNPAPLVEEVRERFGDYRGEKHIYAFTWPSPEHTRQAGEALCSAARQRAEVVEWLLAERLPDWDLAYVVWSEFHSIIEPMWHGLDASHALHDHPTAALSAQMVMNVYQAADAGIGRLADMFPDASLVLFSMHGMGSNDADVPAMALLPELMYRRYAGEALLHPRADWAAPRVPLLGPGESWGKSVIACLHHKPRSILGRLRHGMQRLRNRKNPTRSLNWMPAAHYQRYWREMEAFAIPSFYDGRIRINLKGRERHGRIAPAEYDDTCRKIRRLLLELSDPLTGGKAVRDVVCKPLAEAMQANRSECDIMVFWQPGVYALQHPEFGTIGPLPPRRTGGHTGGHGLAWVRSHRIAAGDYAVQSAWNVVPTVLDLLGVARPAAMSGDSLLQQGESGRQPDGAAAVRRSA